MATRLLLADDHVLVRQGLKGLVEQAGMVVMGEASDGPEALRLAHTHPPDVALLDIAMPHLNGLETARRLRETLPQIKSILLTMHTDEPYVFEALQGRGGWLRREDAGGGGPRAGHPHRSPRRNLCESLGPARGGAGLFARDTPAAGPADLARARGLTAHRGGADDKGDRGEPGAERQNRRVASHQLDAEARHP
jgi:CheY-like chemotaxis protein